MAPPRLPGTLESCAMRERRYRGRALHAGAVAPQLALLPPMQPVPPQGVHVLRNVQDADSLLEAIKACKAAGGKVRGARGCHHGAKASPARCNC